MVSSRQPKALSDLLKNYQVGESGRYISQEFQDFGYRLAASLDDIAHKSLYMRLAKTVDRGTLEKALSFVSDSNAHSKARLFMWKLKQLRQIKSTPARTKPQDEELELFPLGSQDEL